MIDRISNFCSLTALIIKQCNHAMYFRHFFLVTPEIRVNTTAISIPVIHIHDTRLDNRTRD